MSHFLQKGGKTVFRSQQKYPPLPSSTYPFPDPAQIPKSYPRKHQMLEDLACSLTNPLWLGDLRSQLTSGNHPPEARSLRQAGRLSWMPVTGTDLPPQKLAVYLVVFIYWVVPLFLSCSVCPPSLPLSILLSFPITPFIHSFIFVFTLFTELLSDA